MDRHDRRGHRVRYPQSQRYPRRYDGNVVEVVADLRGCRVGLVGHHGDLVDRQGDLAENVPPAAVIVLFVGQGILEAADTEMDA